MLSLATAALICVDGHDAAAAAAWTFESTATAVDAIEVDPAAAAAKASWSDAPTLARPPSGGGAPRLSAALAAPSAAESDPELFLVQRQAYGYWTHYLLQAADGAPLGVVERRHWRQPWRRRYDFSDVRGTPRAHATQPWLSFGNVLAWNAELRLEGSGGEALGRLRGRLWTLQAAAYDLVDPDGTVVGRAAVDDCGQGVLVVAPDGGRLLATLLREQQATRGSDRWNVRVEPGAPLSREAWPLIAAFFADAWSRIARGCEEG